MAATRADITRWLRSPSTDQRWTHMIVVCDTFDYDDYPVYVTPGKTVLGELERLRRGTMNRVMEVYSAALPFDDQLAEPRAWHVEELETPERVEWVEQPGGWLEAIVGKTTITIEARPTYCDRGRWYAKCFEDPVTGRPLDEQEGWPRYYFDLDVAKSEIQAWADKRLEAS